jgi:hypothetical protein
VRRHLPVGGRRVPPPIGYGPGVAFAIESLDVAGEPEAWGKAGFSVDADGSCRTGRVHLRISPGAGEKGVVAWTVAGLDDAGDDPISIDGLPTSEGTDGPAEPAQHPNGVTHIDHLVVTTPDLERTVGALRAQGFAERRTREAVEVRQTFFRLGEVILEVVGRDRPSGTGPARFFGLAFTVADLDATAALLGEGLGPVKGAVQPGRRIATLRHEDYGITVPVAFMSGERPR